MNLVSWNIACLPWYINTISDPEKRIYTIIDKILEINPDMISLQEVFTYDISLILEIELKKYGYYIINYTKLSIHENCGLFFASKIRIKKSKLIIYNDSCGEDWFVSKGFIKIMLENDIKIYITHTQADAIFSSENKSRVIRNFQLKHLFDDIFLGEKTIIIGDLNIKNDTVEFNNLKNVLNTKGQFILNESGNLDFIILLNINLINIKYIQYVFNSLSDHPILECQTKYKI